MKEEVDAICGPRYRPDPSSSLGGRRDFEFRKAADDTKEVQEIAFENAGFPVAIIPEDG